MDVEKQDASAKGAKCESLGHRPRAETRYCSVALKARNDVGCGAITTAFGRDFLFRAFSAFQKSGTLTQGVALGFHISRLWR